MKKLISFALVLAMVAAMAVGCAPANPDETKGNDANLPASALEILETVWNATAEDAKFMAMGGSMSAPVDGKPGAVEATDTDMLTGTLKVPADLAANIDGAASLLNGMMLNNFTGAAFHVTTDAASFATSLRDAIQATQWMCGFPEKLVVYTIGNEYVVYAFGLGDFISSFNAVMTTSYPDAVVAYNEAIEG